MERDDPAVYRDRLLVERIAGILGFEWLSDRLPSDVYPPYLLVVATLVVQYGVIDGVNYVAGRTTVVDDPASIITGIGLVFAVAGGRWMRDQYAEAVSELRLSRREAEDSADLRGTFEGLISLRIKLLWYAVGLAAFFANAFVLLGWETLVELQGVLGAPIQVFVVMPIVYVPAMIEFGLLYLGIHVVLPRRIAAADLDLFYYDPRNMGGFGAVGQLLKRSYYLLTTGLVLYFLLVYGPVLLSEFLPSPYPDPKAPILIMFTALWLAGVASIAYSMYRMHTVMSRKKADTIREIEAEIRSILEDPYDINTAHIADHERREAIQHRLERVRATREYPSTFTMWSQIAISVLLPQALQLAVQFAP